MIVPAHLCEGVCECGGNQAQDNEDLHGLVWFEGGKLKQNSEWFGLVAGNCNFFKIVVRISARKLKISGYMKLKALVARN